MVGAGVVGCAVAHELTRHGHTPFVMEMGPRIAEGVTSRNSGVIHAGLYYSPGSLKADACIRGAALLYEWCEARHVPHKKTGKWVVGTDDETEELEAIFQNARASSAHGIELKKNVSLPGVKCTQGLWSPNTGIVDPYEYSKSFRLAAEEKGAEFLVHTKVTGIERQGAGYLVHTTRGEMEVDAVINCAGLYADEVAAMAGAGSYTVHPWRGDYFTWSTSRTYDYLIYPVKKKNAPGLGVHLTLSLDGRMKFGPDVKLATSKEDFGEPANVEELRIKFCEAASKYLEGIRPEDFRYDTCGVRPKLRAPSDKEEKDFVISKDAPGFINLMGIESPGLTSSMDLAERAVRLL